VNIVTEKEIGFKAEKLSDSTLENLKEFALLCRSDILKMTTIANSGHPGGSLSSVDIYTVLYNCAKIDPAQPFRKDRDRIVISHGHTAPGVYAVLGRRGFFPVEEALLYFRFCGSPYEGHIEKSVPGVEWNTGNLGQGLSAGCGFAIAGRLLGLEFNTFVVMGDGEQQKGQISEARRVAIKYNLPLVVIIDYNKLQISGSISSVMPQNIKENFLSDRWNVLEIDGHSLEEIYTAIKTALLSRYPTAILANTVMGKGVSFMENKHEYHGKPLTIEQCHKALKELGVEDNLEELLNKRRALNFATIDWQSIKGRYNSAHKKVIAVTNTMAEKDAGFYIPEASVSINTGEPILYTKSLDNRSAFGEALASIALANREYGKLPIAVLDCDLSVSVKTDKFAKLFPQNFFQFGIQEHNTATVAGAISTTGIVTFWADFGVFGICETYNQQRLNDINNTNLKLICTHLGVDVGEDGKTHQCIDYIGVMRNLYGFKIIIPADANQTDRVVRYVATRTGNFLVGMGRSSLPIILTEKGEPFFGKDYKFSYGKGDLLREGDAASLITIGTMTHKALTVWEKLAEEGIYIKVINITCPLCLDRALLMEAAYTGIIVTYEDHNVNTGLGSIVASFLLEENIKNVRLLRLGINQYPASGAADDLFKIYGLDVETVSKRIKELIIK